MASTPLQFDQTAAGALTFICYSVAERLAACGIPFVFATGYRDHALGADYADRPVLKKPFRYPELACALSRLLS